jgi:two-component system, NarL family, sensor histidine kinase BarA
LRRGSSPNRDTRIVALTAHVLPEEQRQMVAAGFNRCITKPITEDQLLQLLVNPDRTDIALVAPQQSDAVAPGRPVELALCLQRAQQKPLLAKEFLLGLLQSLPATHANLLRLREARDDAGLLQAVHQLHGACCYSGVPRLQQCTRAVEDLLKRNSGERAPVETALDAMLVALEELMEWREGHDMDVLFEAVEL